MFTSVLLLTTSGLLPLVIVPSFKSIAVPLWHDFYFRDLCVCDSPCLAADSCIWFCWEPSCSLSPLRMYLRLCGMTYPISCIGSAWVWCRAFDWPNCILLLCGDVVYPQTFDGETSSHIVSLSFIHSIQTCYYLCWIIHSCSVTLFWPRNVDPYTCF